MRSALKAEPSNSGKTWTPEMDDALIQYLKEGKRLVEIAFSCGRTQVAIVGRMQFLVQNEIEFRRLKKIIVEAL